MARTIGEIQRMEFKHQIQQLQSIVEHLRADVDRLQERSGETLAALCNLTGAEHSSQLGTSISTAKDDSSQSREELRPMLAVLQTRIRHIEDQLSLKERISPQVCTLESFVEHLEHQLKPLMCQS